MRGGSLTIGGLSCRVLEAEEPRPHLVVVLCHGFGAPGDDLVPIGTELIRASSVLRDRVRFVFPAAPYRLEQVGLADSRAWWPLDMEALTTAMDRGEFLDRRKETPPELPEMRALLVRLVDQAQQHSELSTSRIVLGGFSQGAMLATDAALHLESSPAALAIFSGAIMSEDEWMRRAPSRRGMPVLQSHGRQDSLLPFAGAELLRDLLTSAGLSVDFLAFDGPHTIPPWAIDRLQALLERLVATSS